MKKTIIVIIGLALSVLVYFFFYGFCFGFGMGGFSYVAAFFLTVGVIGAIYKFYDAKKVTCPNCAQVNRVDKKATVYTCSKCKKQYKFVNQ